MAIATPRSPGMTELAKAIGIDTSRCVGFTIVCKPDEVVRLHVTYVLREEDALRAVEVFNKYELKEKE